MMANTIRAFTCFFDELRSQSLKLPQNGEMYNKQRWVFRIDLDDDDDDDDDGEE